MSTGRLPPVTLTAMLLRWHDPSSRALPWRAPGTSPWAILLSEVMTQQTQAERVVPAWSQFVQRFPTPAAMAAAGPAAVIGRWQGLGYNRRALNLHRCAVAITAAHRGEVPRELDALLALPGIGPYTARAVQAFAFGGTTVPVDTNVSRVLSRTADVPLTRPDAQRRADDLLLGDTPPAAAAAPVAAALMDLGATVCTSRNPACDTCPLRPRCRWGRRRHAAASAGRPAPADPAAASGHRPRPQGRFEGSSRQARGRVLDALRAGPLTAAEAALLGGRHGRDAIATLVRDGLAVELDGVFALPGSAGKGMDEADDAGDGGA